MDEIKDQFFTITEKLVKILDALIASLQKNATVLERAREEQDERSKTPPVLNAVLQVPESVIRELRPTEKPITARALQHLKEVAEVVAAAAVVIYSVVAVFQWIEMDRSANAAENAAMIASHQVILASNTAKATLEQFRQDQRAWVGVVQADNPSLVPQPDFKIVVTVMNSGKTPAKNFRSLVVLRSQPQGDKFFPVYGKLDETPSVSVIQPGERAPLITKSYPLNQGQINYVKQGKFILYVYGKLTYDDVFGRGHFTTFCKQVLNETMIRNCGAYNDAN